MKCIAEGCEKDGYARGYCQKHYARFSKYGNANAVRQTEFMSPEARFWRKVDRRGDDECWTWTAGHGGAPSGGINYGSFTLNDRAIRAHVFSFKLHHGNLPAKMVVMHSCDNPRCVNPAHLRAGTQSENIKESIAKGRFNHCNHTKNRPKGDSHHASKLTEDDVRAIRSEQFKTATDAAKRYGISVANACLIRKRKAWKHVT